MVVTAQSGRPAQIPALTGLRGFAALCVLVDHFSVWTSPATETPPAWFLSRMAISSVGMTTFFTLSGFVIAMSCSHWDWRSTPLTSLTRLLFYRIARLYPAYLLFMGLVVLRTPQLQDLSHSYAQRYVAIHLGLLQSWWPMMFDGQLPGAGYFHVSWSLSTEWGLYLLFGLGAVLASAVAWPATRIAAALFAALLLVLVCTRLAGPPANWTEELWTGWTMGIWPIGVALKFGLGVLAYRLRSLGTRTWSNVGASILFGAFLLIELSGNADHGIAFSMIVALGVAFVLVGAQSDGWINGILSRRGLVYVGTISFSLYLLHFIAPSVPLGPRQFQAWTEKAWLYYVINFGASTLFAMIIATGSYRLVEVPGRKLIRLAADRLLGVQSALPQAAGQRAPSPKLT